MDAFAYDPRQALFQKSLTVSIMFQDVDFVWASVKNFSGGSVLVELVQSASLQSQSYALSAGFFFEVIQLFL